LVLALAGVSPNAFAAGGTWTTLASMLQPAYNAAGGVINGQVYVASGSSSQVQAYNPVTNSWNSKCDIPTPVGGSAYGVIDGKLYVVGGSANFSYWTNILQVYDSASNSWTSGAPLTIPNIGEAQAGVIDDKLYVAGGRRCYDGNTGGGYSVNSLWVYDPATNTWSPKAPMSTYRGAAAAAVINGKLYVLGGYSRNDEGPDNSTYTYNTMEVYDPATDTWSTKAPMPTNRWYHNVAVVNGILYVMGGYSSINNGISEIIDTVYAYDPVTNTWTTNTTLPGWVLRPISAVIDGVLYVAGGVNNSSITDNLWAFTPPVNSPPSANAGGNRSILSTNQAATILLGTASDLDGDPLTYRWLKDGTTELVSGSVQGGQALLNLGTLPFLQTGQYNLTLEVNDGHVTSRDTMVLTVENSSPIAAPTGAGTYPLNTSVTLGGQVSDFDGDSLTYRWMEGTTVLTQDVVQGTLGGQPVSLPFFIISNLPVGNHQIVLQVSDGFNAPVSEGITVVIDGEPPTLAPVADKTILWPPNHQMVPVTITTNAKDNSGMAVTLAVSVSCNEPNDGSQYWTEPVIDQSTGIITLQLQASRLGKGKGRQYTIYIVAKDQSGNSSAVQVVIVVPHDQGKN
jgi:N-acetylneuraminic acid mutarotase